MWMYFHSVIGTRKIGCKATCTIRRVLRFPQFALDGSSMESKSQRVKQSVLLKEALQKDGGDFSTVTVDERYG